MFLQLGSTPELFFKLHLSEQVNIRRLMWKREKTKHSIAYTVEMLEFREIII